MAIDYPSYTAHVERTRIAEAKGQVLEMASLLERYRAQNFSYNGASLPASANTPFYTFALSGHTTSPHQAYTITATPRGPMAGTGVLVLNHQGQTCTGVTSCTVSASSSWDD